LFPGTSYFLSMILLMIILGFKITLAMTAGRGEACACSPGHRVELSSCRAADSHEPGNLPYQIRSWNGEHLSFFYSMLSFLS
jgi:hypothetical protein